MSDHEDIEELIGEDIENNSHHVIHNKNGLLVDPANILEESIEMEIAPIEDWYDPDGTSVTEEEIEAVNAVVGLGGSTYGSLISDHGLPAEIWSKAGYKNGFTMSPTSFLPEVISEPHMEIDAPEQQNMNEQLNELAEQIKLIAAEEGVPADQYLQYMLDIQALDRDFCNMHGFVNSEFLIAPDVVVTSDRVWVMRLTAGQTKSIQIRDTIDVGEVTRTYKANVIGGRIYGIVCRNKQKVIFQCTGTGNTDAAVVRIFPFSSNDETYPEFPLREDKSWTLLATAETKYQFRVFPSEVPTEALNSFEADFVVPMCLRYSLEDTVHCALNVKHMLRIYGLHVTAHHREVLPMAINLVTTQIALEQRTVEAQPENIENLEPWKRYVEHLNSDLRSIMQLTNTIFLHRHGRQNLRLLQGKLYALRMNPGNSLSFRSQSTTHINAVAMMEYTIHPNNSYFVVLGNKEIWDIKCCSQGNDNRPALLRILTLSARYEQQRNSLLPFRSDRPCFLLARIGAQYLIRLFPPRFDQELLRILDPQSPAINKEYGTGRHYLVTEYITLNVVRMTSSVILEGRVRSVAEIYISEEYKVDSFQKLQLLYDAHSSAQAMPTSKTDIFRDHSYS